MCATQPARPSGASHELRLVGPGTGVDEVMAQAGRENFPVASRLFPREVRPHLLAVYGFARLVDDLGDEAPGDRLALLAAVSAELDAVFAGGTPSHELLRRLAVTVRRCALPRDPFDRLVRANVQDQTVGRYETYADLLAYCRLSAAPVGELVLRVAGVCTPQRLELSDRICAGLQLAEFWQDVGEDAAMGRVYLPAEDLRRFGYGEEDVLAGVYDERFVALMEFEAERTRRLLESGRPLYRGLQVRLGLAIRMYAAGGFAALADLRRRRYATLAASAHPGTARVLLAGLREVVRG